MFKSELKSEVLAKKSQNAISVFQKTIRFRISSC